MFKKRIRQFGYLMLLVALFFGVQDIVAPKGLGSMAAATEFSVAITQDRNRPSLDKSKVAYLTFDDGPTRYTALIMNILAEYGAKATFFMLEPQMEKNTEILHRMKREGYAFGLHGVTHNYKEFYKSSESALTEMNTAQAKLHELTGLKTFLVRTPYGSKPYMKPAYMEAAQMAGYKIWDWNVDSKDWFYKDERMVSKTIEQVMALEQRGVQPVILFHDMEKTVEFLPQVLEYLTNNGYSLEALDAGMKPVQLK